MISVVIPLYNKDAIIEKTLRSILMQDCDNFEVVVVNDGSTDRSLEIVKGVNDSRIKLVEQENGGPSKARNTGIIYAKGEWILFLDADDELMPGALRKYNELIAKTERKCDGVSLIASPFYRYDGKKKILSCTFEKALLRNPFKDFFEGSFLMCTGSFICLRSLLLKCPFNENIRRYEDFDVWFQLLRNAKVLTDDKPVITINDQYSSASYKRKDIKEDFVGHLDFRGKSFWEKMCLYKLFLWERLNYPKQMKELYPTLYWRFDYLLTYKFFNLWNKLKAKK